ncbi:MAG: hypothetical protein SPI83_02255 [Rothia sp. (in: high G+C Gram-positive bacteria)]|nr:hypothetical protein [Rothia sp. (in: high G+C Gram-positive bacteria)]
MPHALKYCVSALLLLLAIVNVALFSVIRADGYEKAITNYLDQGRSFTISDLSSDQVAQVERYLNEKILQEQAALIRADKKLSAADGSADGTHLGLLADPNNLSKLPELNYLGVSILNTENMASLLVSNQGKTLGLYTVEENTLQELPEVIFGPNLSVGKLSDMVEETDTINGQYFLYGFSEDDFHVFLQELSAISGISQDKLLNPLSGSNQSTSLLPIFILISLLSVSALFTLVLFVYITQGTKELGAYLILGWSKTNYLINLAKPIVYTFIPASLLTALGNWFTVKDFGVNLAMLPGMIYPLMLTIGITITSFFLSSLPVLGVKPIHAVRGYKPQKVFAVLLALGFMTTTVGLYATASFLDAPLKEVNKIATVQKEWDSVADQYILYSQATGSDSVSFTGQSTDLAEDFYEWYTSIEKENGVSLVNTYYIDQELLQQWKALGEETPNREFWYMAASPSYLYKIGIEIPPATLQRAETGEQVFLLPKHFSSQDKSSLTNWLEQEAQRKGNAEQNITTAFTQNPRTYVEDYSLDSEIFTWSTDPEKEFLSSDVVIYVATAANMTYFETESLVASGLADSYIKLSDEAVQKYTSQSYLERFDLDDNQPIFISSKSFVAGLQKSIYQYLQFFGTITLLLGLIVIFALIAFAMLYSLIFRNYIAVSRLLGHSLWSSFRLTFLLVILINMLGLVAMIVIGSRVGSLVSLLMLAGQPALLYMLSRKFAYSHMVSLIKES